MYLVTQKVEQYRRVHYQASFGIDSWYEGLEEHTFKTIHLNLSHGSTVLLTFRVCERTSLCQPRSHGTWSPSPPTAGRFPQSHPCISHKAQINDALAQFPNGVFLKLNTR